MEDVATSKAATAGDKELDSLVRDIAEIDKLVSNRPFNLFHILKIAKTEIRHSNILVWLLNPRGSHNFGSRFLGKMLDRFNCGFPDVDPNSLESVEVRREENHFDLTLVFPTCKKAIVTKESNQPSARLSASSSDGLKRNRTSGSRVFRD